MDKTSFISFVETKAKLKYTRDSYGNYKATDSKGIVVRYKINANSVRHERQESFEDFEGHMKTYWFKLWSEYYKNLEINPELGTLRRIKKSL